MFGFLNSKCKAVIAETLEEVQALRGGCKKCSSLHWRATKEGLLGYLYSELKKTKFKAWGEMNNV